MPLFGTSVLSNNVECGVQVAEALCLPVSVTELLQANQLGSVRLFIVFRKISNILSHLLM